MKKTILALTMATIATGALATSTTSTVKTSIKQSKLEKFLKNSRLTYYSQYSGARFNGTNDAKTVGANFWNQVKFSHSIGGGVNVFTSHAFQVNQFSEKSDGTKQDQYLVDDFRVGIEKWSNYTKNISYRNRIRLESPSKDYGEIKAHKNARIRASHLVTTTINSVHGLTGIISGGKWIYNNAEDQEKNSQYYLNLYGGYQYNFTSKFSAAVQYDFSVSNRADINGLLDNARNYQEIYLGTNYTLNKALTLGTYLHTKGGSGDSGMKIDDNTFINVQLSGRIF